jgi:hypothetical protein
MLFEDRPIAIVDDPEAFPQNDYEGLAVEDDDWPPLLRPRMLMDLESYEAWERHMVERCADADSSPEDVVATLRRDVELLRDFDPMRERLVRRIRGIGGVVTRALVPADLQSSIAHFTIVMATVPDDLKPAPDEDGLNEAYVEFVRDAWPDWRSPLKRYLAAKAFANWTAYQGRGVAAIVRGLDAALALVRVEASRQCRNNRRPLDQAQLREAIRAADFALNHLAVGEELASAWSAGLE